MTNKLFRLDDAVKSEADTLIGAMALLELAMRVNWQPLAPIGQKVDWQEAARCVGALLGLTDVSREEAGKLLALRMQAVQDNGTGERPQA